MLPVAIAGNFMGVSSWCEVEVLVRKRLHRRCVVRLPESAMQAAPLKYE